MASRSTVSERGASSALPWALVVVLILGGAAVWVLRRQPSIERVEVRGTVTMDGRMLSQAVIVFIPAARTAEQRKSGSEIAKGVYQLVGNDGLVPGDYRVEISSYLGPEYESPMARQKLPRPVGIPSRYNRQSKLTASVGSQPAQTINLTLTSQP